MRQLLRFLEVEEFDAANHFLPALKTGTLDVTELLEKTRVPCLRH